MNKEEEEKRENIYYILYIINLRMCSESTVASARSVPVCAGLLATPHYDPLWKAHRLVFWVAQSFIFINERFSNLSPLVKDSPNWKKFEKRRVHNFSLGHGGNVREFGSPCPGCRFSCKKMKKQQNNNKHQQH